MGKSGQSLGFVFAFMLLLAFATPAYTQDAEETPDHSDVILSSPGDSEVQSDSKDNAAAATTTHHTAKKKSKAAHHKKAKKKKKAHKAPAKKHHAKKTAKKSAKKSHAAAHKKPVKHAAPKAKDKEVDQAPLAPVNPQSKEAIKQSVEPEKIQEEQKEIAQPKMTAPVVAPVAPAMTAPKSEEPKTGAKPETKSEATEPAETAEPAAAATSEKPAKVEKTERAEKAKPSHKSAAAVAKKAPALAEAPKAKTASGGGKTVTYTFCLGYDNCTPYRYEAMVHGSSTDAKIFKENPDGGGWVETKIDPVMASDLNGMAHAESSSDIARPLTVTEKARIADHQGKAHVELVAAANDGHKDQAKQMMKDLGIHNSEELSDYDPRLAKNDTAMQAANELSAGR